MYTVAKRLGFVITKMGGKTIIVEKNREIEVSNGKNVWKDLQAHIPNIHLPNP